jgi:putative intracellular protease/amidase
MNKARLPILMIITSHATLGDTGKPTGVWAEELTTPYYELINAGCAVEFASPAGMAPCGTPLLMSQRLALSAIRSTQANRWRLCVMAQQA